MRRSVFFWSCYLLWIFIFACNDGSSPTPSNPGYVSFELNYLPAAPYQGLAASRNPLKLDCTASGVAEIEAIIYDQDNLEYKRGGPWNCDAGSGTVQGVPPGTNLKIVLLGRNTEGLLVFRGEKQQINIYPGQHTDAGEIIAVSIQPVVSISSDQPNSLLWRNDAGAFKFTVQVSENGRFDPLLLNDTTTQSLFVPSGLTPGQTYHARVIPWAYPDVEGKGSEIVIFTAMAAPTLLSPAEGAHLNVNGQLNFQWNGTTGADAYRIVISTASDLSEPLIDVVTSDTAYAAPNNLPDMTYHWQVFARDIQGNEGSRSSMRSFVLGTIPGAPTDVSTTAGNHTATIRWSSLPNAASYTVYWSTTDGVSKTRFDGKFESITGTEFTHKDCTNKIPYYYIVTASNGFGEGASSAEVTCLPTPEWFITTGTADQDIGNGISVDQDGNIYVIGNTRASLHDEPHAGEQDVAIVKYDADGNRIRTILTGTSYDDQGNGIAVDQDGNIFVTGNLDLSLSRIDQGCFVTKYSPGGIKQWQERYSDHTEWMIGLAIAVGPNGYAYATGYMGGSDHGTMILKYDTNGVAQVSTVTSPPSGYGSEGHAIAVDNQGDFYITGWWDRPETGLDILVAKYGNNGEERFMRYRSTDKEDVGKGIALDPDGNYYLTGYTYGDLGPDNSNAGQCDAFIMKFNPNDLELWTRLLGTPAADQGLGITVDHHGNSYVTGYTCGELDGHPTSGGSCDVFIAKYDTDGNKLWVEVKGGNQIDSGRDVALDQEGNVVVTGVYADDIFVWKH